MRRLARILVCIAVVAAPLVVVAAMQPPTSLAAAPTEGVQLGMPFSDRWTINETPATHHRPGGGDWAIDLFGTPGTAVQVQLANPSGQLSLNVESRWTSCGGAAGTGVKIRVRVDGQDVGWISYAHLDQAVGIGPIANGSVIGRTKLWGWCDGSWEVSQSAGVHTHFEARNTQEYSCWTQYQVGARLALGAQIGQLGAPSVGGPNTVCAATPTNPLVEGNFINFNGNIYRIVGGAPIYVSSWAAVGGAQPAPAVTQAQFESLRTYPADGTVVAAAGFIYIFAGGAPVYLDSWDSVGGYRGQTIWVIDHAAIDAADGPSPWNHIRRYPADGTIVAAGGYIYVFAGGAPLYVNSWDNMGGYQGQTITTIALPALENITASPPWNHVRYYPADGTAVLAGADAFVFAGGAPLYVGNWSAVGGERSTVRIAAPVLDNADGPPPWNHIHQYPADGTELRGGPTGAFYRVLDGVAEPVDTATYPTVIDQAAIDNAGTGGVWNHLKAPTPPAPVDEVSVSVTGQLAYSASGPVTSGGYDISKNRDGSLRSVSGTAPLANGAQLSVKATQFWILPMFTGSTTLTDTAAGLSLNTPILFGKVAMQANTVSATQGWFDLRTWPWKSYSLAWSITDS